ncbi:MAG: protein kinase domain-containing protein, partial [Planctomycetia bacterium]
MQPMQACRRCGATIPEAGPMKALGGLCPACVLRRQLQEPPDAARERARRLPAPSIAELAPHFPDLEFEALIGQGGMGAVYRVVQKGLGRVAALKVLALDAESEPEFGVRFEREARLLAGLQHKNIVGIHAAGRSGPHWYLLMELVEGSSLRQLIESGEVEPRLALSIVGQVCDALQHAHERGVVHRDVKPENILVARDGTAKILDFGLAKMVGQEPRAHTLTLSGQVMGTLRYMAPEQYERPLEVDHRADIYSLGVVLYELLTGEVPMGAFAPASRKAKVDARVDEIVRRSLEREPAMRYQHASDVSVDVARLGERAATTPPAPALGAAPGSHAGTAVPARRAPLGRSIARFFAHSLWMAGLALSFLSWAPHDGGAMRDVLVLLGACAAVAGGAVLAFVLRGEHAFHRWHLAATLAGGVATFAASCCFALLVAAPSKPGPQVALAVFVVSSLVAMHAGSKVRALLGEGASWKAGAGGSALGLAPLPMILVVDLLVDARATPDWMDAWMTAGARVLGASGLYLLAFAWWIFAQAMHATAAAPAMPRLGTARLAGLVLSSTLAAIGLGVAGGLLALASIDALSNAQATLALPLAATVGGLGILGAAWSAAGAARRGAGAAFALGGTACLALGALAAWRAEGLHGWRELVARRAIALELHDARFQPLAEGQLFQWDVDPNAPMPSMDWEPTNQGSVRISRFQERFPGGPHQPRIAAGMLPADEVGFHAFWAAMLWTQYRAQLLAHHEVVSSRDGRVVLRVPKLPSVERLTKCADAILDL